MSEHARRTTFGGAADGIGSVGGADGVGEVGGVGETADVKPGDEQTPRRPAGSGAGSPTPPQASSASPTASPALPQGDIGRRIATRREQLGLSREETAARAGTAASYIQYLEEEPTATPGTSVLIRVAGALDTTLSALRGGDADLPPGLGQAARHPELVELGPEQCRARLSTHGVGRVAADTPDGLVVLPVNYSVADGEIAFRTAPGSVIASAVGSRVAFEVDHVDDAHSQGWSVLVQGRARSVTDDDTMRRLDASARSRPWAGGEGRDLWIRIDEQRVTGRRIVVP